MKPSGKRLTQMTAEEVRAWWRLLTMDQRDEVTFGCDFEEWAAICRAFGKDP